jgi:hypothetical protein
MEMIGLEAHVMQDGVFVAAQALLGALNAAGDIERLERVAVREVAGPAQQVLLLVDALEPEGAALTIERGLAQPDTAPPGFQRSPQELREAGRELDQRQCSQLVDAPKLDGELGDARVRDLEGTVVVLHSRSTRRR